MRIQIDKNRKEFWFMSLRSPVKWQISSLHQIYLPLYLNQKLFALCTYKNKKYIPDKMYYEEVQSTRLQDIVHTFASFLSSVYNGICSNTAGNPSLIA